MWWITGPASSRLLPLGQARGQVGKCPAGLVCFFSDEFSDPVAEKVALVPAEIPEQPLGIPDNPEVVVLEFVEIEPTKHLPNFVHGVAQSEEGGVDGTGRGAPNTTYP